MAPRIGQKITQDGKVYHIQNVVPTSEKINNLFGYDFDVVLTEGEAELRKPIYLGMYSNDDGFVGPIFETRHFVRIDKNVTTIDQLWSSSI